MARAGLLYFSLLFALGFPLGVVRTVLLEPRLGPVGAVLVEAVPMLAAMWVLAPRLARRCQVPPDLAARLGMGGIALALLALAETALDALLRPAGPAFWIERTRTPEGLIGLGLMLAFALMPALRRAA